MISDIKKLSNFLFIFFFITVTNFALAKDTSVSFFYSNNKQIIDLQHAFKRLTGNEQQQMEEEIVPILQQAHFEQGRFKNILGLYTMEAGKITADNSEQYLTSPLQSFTDKKLLAFATQLANRLEQETIGIFIPSAESDVGYIEVTFTAKNLTINHTLKLIKDKLDPSYNKAFSLNLNYPLINYDTATVHSIIWIGSKLQVDDIKRAFPDDKIKSIHGTSYLVDRKGNINRI